VWGQTTTPQIHYADLAYILSAVSPQPRPHDPYDSLNDAFPHPRTSGTGRGRIRYRRRPRHRRAQKEPPAGCRPGAVAGLVALAAVGRAAGRGVGGLRIAMSGRGR